MKPLSYILLIVVCIAGILPMQAQNEAAEQMQRDMRYLEQPYSVIDQMTLTKMKLDAPKYASEPGYDNYVSAIAKAEECMSLYNNAESALNKPYNAAKIVEIRTEIIRRLDDADFYTADQRKEMDLLDIYLSRYRGALSQFQDIIRKINADPAVTAYREKTKKDRPSRDDRDGAKKAISAIVYRPNSSDFTQEIKDYINIIPYLKERLPQYLNSVMQQPASKSDIEKQIMSIRP